MAGILQDSIDKGKLQRLSAFRILHGHLATCKVLMLQPFW